MQRPKRKENEDDLLRFQEEFLKQRATPSAKVQRVKKANSGTTQQHNSRGNEKGYATSSTESEPKRTFYQASYPPPVLSEITEHTDKTCRTLKQNKFQGGFPVAPQIKNFTDHQPKPFAEKKQSIFARQFLAKKASAFGLKEETYISCKIPPKNSKNEETENPTFENSLQSKEPYNQSGNSFIVTGEGLSSGVQSKQEQASIHKENVEKLSKMTEQDILAEKEKLLSSLDSSLLSFLQKQRSKHKDVKSDNISNEATTSNEDDKAVEDSAMNSLEKPTNSSFCPYDEFNIDKDMPGMSVVEDEKLEWMKDTAKHLCKEDQGFNKIRFDFDGNLIAKDADVPVNEGLHHHGEDSTTPGYSLDELFKLARSSFLQQRVFALRLLAKIMEKYQNGCFDDEIHGCLMESLIDAGLPFLLRWSLDDSTDAVYCAAIYGIYAMVWNCKDQCALDQLMYFCNGFQVQSLKPPNSDKYIKDLKKDKKGNLSDPEMVSIDLIKGLIQIKLLPRLRYILEVCQPDQLTINYCMDILCRCSLHSSESSFKLMECPRMMKTILETLLPVTWSSDNAFPSYKAMRLLRFLCIAGKAISSKLWKDYDLCTRVLRYVSLINGDSDPNREEIDLAIESIHIWRICLLHGTACSTTVDVYPLVISLLQKYAITTKDAHRNIVSSVVLLIESIVRSVMNGTQQKLLDSSKKVHFEDDCRESPCVIEWSVMSGFHSILLQSAKSEVQRFTSSEEGIQNLRSLSTLMSYLSTYADAANMQSCVKKLDLLTEVYDWLELVAVRILESENFKRELDKTSQYSDLLRPKHSLQNHQQPICLPIHGMNIFKEGSRNLDENCAFVFLTSFLKLLHSMAVVNKQCIQKVIPLLKMKSLVDYCRSISSVSATAHKLSATAVSVVVERQFLYHLLSLFELASSLDYSGCLEPSYFAAYQAAAFKLLTLFQSDEQNKANEIMTKLIFNQKMYQSSTNIKDVINKLDSLEISAADKVPMKILFDTGLDNLGHICDVYARFCFQRYAHQSSIVGTWLKDSFLLAKNSGPLFPLDWMFLPVVSLYNQAVSIELSGKVIDKMNEYAIKSIEMNLSFLLLLEMSRPEVLRSIPESVRLIRLLCVFLLGCDAFFESKIHQLLEALASLYTSQVKLEKLEFGISFPGISSFYDLFCELVIQFSASSFGDHVFSNYLLIPLQQRHDVKYRKAVWGEHCDILRCFTLPVTSVFVNLANFLDDFEQDQELLQLYLRNIISQTVKPSRCPFFYLVAVHHLSNYIFNERQIKDYSELKITKSRLDLLNIVIGMKNEEAKSDIILYETVDVNSTKGFRTFTHLPANRQLIIENRQAEMT